MAKNVALFALLLLTSCDSKSETDQINVVELNTVDAEFPNSDSLSIEGTSAADPIDASTLDQYAMPTAVRTHPSYYADDEDDAEEERPAFDEYAAQDAARRAVRRGSFQRYSRGYPCTQDCSGHEAGFDWAKDNRITRRSNCYTDSMSFSEGCEAYVKGVDRELEDRRARYQAGDDTADDY